MVFLFVAILSAASKKVMTKSLNSTAQATNKSIYKIQFKSVFCFVLFHSCLFDRACSVTRCITLSLTIFIVVCILPLRFVAMHLIALELDVILLKSALFILNISLNLHFLLHFAIFTNKKRIKPKFSPFRRRHYTFNK